MITEGIILCGGLGTRLGPDAPPKALVDINGKPLICRQIKWLFDNGIEKVVLALGKNAFQVVQEVNANRMLRKAMSKGDQERKDNEQWENFTTKKIIYSTEPEPRGTAGAIKLALQYITTERFLICNVDDLTDIDIQEMAKTSENVLAVSQFKCPYGIVKQDQWSSRIASFVEKPILDDWVSAGVAIVARKEIEPLLPDKGALETEVYPKMRMHGYKDFRVWLTCNDLKQVRECNDYFRELENDGTVEDQPQQTPTDNI